MERIELGEHSHQRLRTWESGRPGHWRYVHLEVGTLERGGWYAARTTRRGLEAWSALTERQVCQAADAWMRRINADWCETTGLDA